jgi:hypothetical protein
MALTLMCNRTTSSSVIHLAMIASGPRQSARIVRHKKHQKRYISLHTLVVNVLQAGLSLPKIPVKSVIATALSAGSSVTSAEPVRLASSSTATLIVRAMRTARRTDTSSSDKLVAGVISFVSAAHGIQRSASNVHQVSTSTQEATTHAGLSVICPESLSIQ